MVEKYQNQYRVPSARAKWHDYSKNDAYFITICVQEHRCLFGEIADSKMVLSPLGILADVLWHEIPYHVKNVKLDSFIVMPNHLHGILFLENPVEVLNLTSQIPTNNIDEASSRISPKKDSISVIIRSYKSAVTRHAKRLGLSFSWQARFYDRIIRDRDELQSIRNYIENNPKHWEKDELYH